MLTAVWAAVIWFYLGLFRREVPAAASTSDPADTPALAPA